MRDRGTGPEDLPPQGGRGGRGAVRRVLAAGPRVGLDRSRTLRRVGPVPSMRVVGERQGLAQREARRRAWGDDRNLLGLLLGAKKAGALRPRPLPVAVRGCGMMSFVG